MSNNLQEVTKQRVKELHLEVRIFKSSLEGSCFVPDTRKQLLKCLVDYEKKLKELLDK